MEMTNPLLVSTAFAGLIGMIYGGGDLESMNATKASDSTFPSAVWMGHIPHKEELSKSSRGDNWDFVSVIRSLPDAWTTSTLEMIAAHRSLESGWDGKSALPPSKESLDTAEMMTWAFAAADSNIRPSFAVDVDGNPGFAAFDNDLYLHLTIDKPNMVSCYTMKDGKSVYREQATVDSFTSLQFISDILMKA